MTVTVSSNTAQLVGTPSWFDRIEWWGSNGGKHLSTMYSQNLMFNLQLLGRDAIRSANIDPENYCPLYETLAASTTRTYFLPLPASVFNHLYFDNSKGDLVMFFQPSSDIRLEGSGVVTLDSMSIICSTVALTPEDERVHRNLHDSTVVSKYWLEPTRISLSGETLTSGVEKKI